MTIPIEREASDEPAAERCCFCRERTKFWTAMRDRTGGEQVACCKACAAKYSAGDVPTKAAWCEKEYKLMPRRGNNGRW